MADLHTVDRAYLLGDLPPDEAERVELAVMSDPAVGERMTDAENDLIDAYLEGTLTSIERQKFESVFLPAPGRADRLQFARQLAARAGARADIRWGGKRSVLVPLALAASVLLAIGLWYSREPEPTQIAQTPVVPQIPPKPPEVTPPTRTSVPFVLALSSVRSGSTASVSVPEGTDDVVIQIDVSNEPGVSAYDARLTQGAREAWRTLSPVQATADGVLQLTVPAPVPGAYELTVTGRLVSGQPRVLGVMPFAVRR